MWFSAFGRYTLAGVVITNAQRYRKRRAAKTTRLRFGLVFLLFVGLSTFDEQRIRLAHGTANDIELIVREALNLALFGGNNPEFFKADFFTSFSQRKSIVHPTMYFALHSKQPFVQCRFRLASQQNSHAPFRQFPPQLISCGR